MSLDEISKSRTAEIDRAFLEAFDEFLDELSSLSNRESDRRSFYGHLTSRLQNITSAANVTVWMSGPDKSCFPVFASGNSATASMQNRDFSLSIQEFSKILAQRQTVIMEDHRSSIFAHPISSTDKQEMLITMVMGDDVAPQMSQVYSDLLIAVAEIAADFERRTIVGQQQQRFAQLESFVQLLNNSNSSLDPKQIAYHLTNDCRAFLNADRVWLFAGSNRVKLLSCSSVSDVNQRSRSFKDLKGVIAEAVRHRQSYSYVTGEQQQIQTRYRRLSGYFETESPTGIHVMMLKRTGTDQINGVLVAEYFHDHDKSTVISRLNNIVPCVQSSFSNALAHARIPFRRPLLGLAWLMDRFRLGFLPKTAAILAITVAAVFVLFGIPTDFEVDVQGELRPKIERHIFAPTEGLIESVSVEYGNAVQQGQTVARMVSPEYELQIKTLQGELSAARKKLEANQLLRSQADREGRDPVYVGQLTAEIEQNRLEIESINDNINLYLELTSELELTSPINGQVISRDVKLALLDRPVNSGNRLLTVADTTAEWHIVFQVPDREFGYMLDARNSGDVEDWIIRYRLKSDLSQTFESKIERVDQNNAVNEDGESFVKVYVPVDKNVIDELRVGTSVLGKVHCGRESLFFIWTRDVRDFLRANFFWM